MSTITEFYILSHFLAPNITVLDDKRRIDSWND